MWLTVWNRRMAADDARLVIDKMHQRHGVFWNNTKIALFFEDYELKLQVDSECANSRACALEAADDLDTLVAA